MPLFWTHPSQRWPSVLFLVNTWIDATSCKPSFSRRWFTLRHIHPFKILDARIWCQAGWVQWYFRLQRLGQAINLLSFILAIVPLGLCHTSDATFANNSRRKLWTLVVVDMGPLCNPFFRDRILWWSCMWGVYCIPWRSIVRMFQWKETGQWRDILLRSEIRKWPPRPCRRLVHVTAELFGNLWQRTNQEFCENGCDERANCYAKDRSNQNFCFCQAGYQEGIDPPCTGQSVIGKKRQLLLR